jgi:hypothetical protein
MPITINGSGTVTGISAGGLPDDCITTADIAANAVTYAKIGTTEQGQLCKAWVNFNGTSTVAIRASYNVSSITDNGTGDYTVNFTSALADANYCAAVASSNNTNTNIAEGTASYNHATGSCSVITLNVNLGAGAVALADRALVCVAIFR